MFQCLQLLSELHQSEIFQALESQAAKKDDDTPELCLERISIFVLTWVATVQMVSSNLPSPDNIALLDPDSS